MASEPQRPAPEEILLRILKRYYRESSLEQRLETSADPAVREHIQQDRANLREMVTEAARAGDWEGCLWYLPRSCRIWAFVVIIRHRVSDADYWRLVRELWIDGEFPGRQGSWWLDLFGSQRGGREHLMNASELARYRSLPPIVELYRGAWPFWARGMSWTSDLAEAAWFASRFNNTKGRIYRTMVERAAVWACLDERNENEMVIDPRQIPRLRAVRWTQEEIARMGGRAAERKRAEYAALTNQKVVEELDI